jgi:hypothetical protein
MSATAFAMIEYTSISIIRNSDAMFSNKHYICTYNAFSECPFRQKSVFLKFISLELLTKASLKNHTYTNTQLSDLREKLFDLTGL